MKQEEFEPLFIKTDKPGMPGPEHKLAIARHTVKAVEFACEHKLKYIVACLIMSSVVGGLNMVTSLAMDDEDYIENLDGCLSTLEEHEEYELCAEIMKAKEKIIKGLPKKSIRKKKKEAIDNLIGTIKNL